ncbi:MAG: methionine synthase [Oscillospiraceae bacterium]|nr:methionine synthase [Oscillospiraceae bacterium]
MIINEINRTEAFRYLGIKGTPDNATLQLADACEKMLLAEMTPKFCWSYTEISDCQDNSVSLSGYTLSLDGNDISAHLEGCSGAVLLAATLGNNVDMLLRKTQTLDMAKAVILDAMASAAIERVCDEAEKEISARLENKHFTWRFSPGYGDFPIAVQKDFLTVLNAQKVIGLCASQSGMLTPTKSVTAVIGVHEKSVQQQKHSCESCNMRDRCNYRKTGGTCQ